MFRQATTSKMSKNSMMSKTFAAVFALLTVAVIGSLVTMVIVYNIRLRILKPTPRPTLPVTTLAPPPDMRLRGDLLPESYHVFIQVPLYTRIIEEVNVTSPNQTYSFEGNVTIYLQCVQKTKTIFLHSRNQNVFRPHVKNIITNKDVGVKNYTLHNDKSEFLEIQLIDDLNVGQNYSLFLAFQGELNEALEGLFLSTYLEGTPAHVEDTDVNRYMAATNLQPTDARAVFPCFDEPAMKARFHLTIFHRKDTTALSNQKGDTYIMEEDKEWQCTRFQPTEVMSSYLVAFTVSELKTKSASTKIKTYARPEAVDAGYTAYADSITEPILNFYQNYFGILYTQKLGGACVVFRASLIQSLIRRVFVSSLRCLLTVCSIPSLRTQRLHCFASNSSGDSGSGDRQEPRGAPSARPGCASRSAHSRLV
ncbi:alanyl (membrane) aminopeptidase-like b [Boleophthalmus pectinirostris]|uniref:alanyl (membrane) aminopeptidase-like b n=1 Tax=Boleophthalmus pectinirostris TaxID=150288 RepID=UPI0024310F27|nr:alanyl (membrane) aminopeptidase-like b [Boleophthalmus pectinirostris]